MAGSVASPWALVMSLVAIGAGCALAGPQVAVTPAPSETAISPEIAWAEAHRDELIDFYRQLHAHPELSFHEQQTAATLADAWRKLGLQVTTGVGQHGVVGLLKNGAGPTLMLRCDMDALPITEETNLVYSSRVKVTGDGGTEVGVMHACGHDLHMTTVVGAAKFLSEHVNDWQGTLMVVGQPAEERGAGATAMLEDGLFSRWAQPDFAIALHVAPTLPAGMVGYRAGFALANVDSVDITIKGRGGHGAYPHDAIDPVVQAAQLVMDLQTIVSREVKPTEPAVVTVGAIHGGTKHNVISDQCHLQLTVRSYADEVRQQILAAIRRKALAVAQGAGAPDPEITISEGTPSLSNDRDLVERLVPIFRRLLGKEHVIEVEPSLAGEDFSQYGRAGIPIFMYWLGSVEPRRLQRIRALGQVPPSLHSANYFPDAEQALVYGIGTMSAAALELLSPGSPIP